MGVLHKVKQTGKKRTFLMVITFLLNLLWGTKKRRRKLTFLTRLPCQVYSSRPHSFQFISPSSFSLFPHYNPCLAPKLSASYWLSHFPFFCHCTIRKNNSWRNPPPPLPVPPSVLLNMVLMRCWSFILTQHWSQFHVSVPQGHVILLVSVCDSKGGWSPGVFRDPDVLPLPAQS